MFAFAEHGMKTSSHHGEGSASTGRLPAFGLIGFICCEIMARYGKNGKNHYTMLPVALIRAL